MFARTDPENKQINNNTNNTIWKEGKKEMFYLTMHSTHFIYGFVFICEITQIDDAC